MKVQDSTPLVVSFFKGIRSKCPEDMTLEEFITGVCNGRWKVPTDNIRLMKSRGQEKEATIIKGTLPAITVACVCRGGHQEMNIERLTGLIPIDLDHTNERTEEVFRKVCTLPYVAAAFISASGKGVKVIVRSEVTTKEEYPQFFEQAASCIAAETGAKVDTSGKNINRLCFASYHPEAFYSAAAAAAAASRCTQVSAASSCTQVSMRHTTNENSSDDCEGVFLKAMQELNKKQLYVVGNRNNYIFSLVCKLNRLKMSEVDALRLCVRHFELPQEELAAIVKSAYTNVQDKSKEEAKEKRRLATEKRQQLLIARVEEFINERYDLRYNVVLKQVEARSKEKGGEFQPMAAYEQNSMLRELLNNGIKIALPLLRTILNSDLAPEFEPFKSYFDSLPPWDGKEDHIGRLAGTIYTTQPAHWHLCFRKWLVAMVAGWLHPEVVNHTVLVLIGKQGIYKTTWCLSLLPPELKRYCYSGVVDKKSKDCIFTLSECALINYEEIENLDRKELNSFKSLVTQGVINERYFYGTNKEWMIRRASIIGSGNNKDILSDLTGNRRWLCFDVEEIDYNNRTTLSYEGIYAQAKALLDSGFQYWFDKDEMQELSLHNTEFMLRNIEEEQLAVWFRKPEHGEKFVLMTASQITGRLMQWVHVTMSNVRVGRALKAEGYQCQVLRGNVKVYRVVERNPEEVKEQGLEL